MKEYDHCSTNREFIYNNMLRIAKNLIECVFCRLKVKWSMLTRKMDIKLENVSAVIYACFVFYNFCEKHDLYVDRNQVKIQIGTMRQKEKDQCPVNFWFHLTQQFQPSISITQKPLYCTFTLHSVEKRVFFANSSACESELMRH